MPLLTYANPARRRLRGGGILIAAALVLAAPSLQAAELAIASFEEIGQDAERKVALHLHLSGPIDGTEIDALSEVLGTLDIATLAPQARQIEITLDSAGGGFADGLRLADFFDAQIIATRVQAGARCLSACALAFLGGSRWDPDLAFVTSRRVVEPGASLGFHAPALALSEDGDFDSRSVASAYATALESMGALVDRDVTIPRGLIRAIITTPPNEMFILRTVDEFLAWDIDVDWRPADWQPDAVDIARICAHGNAWRMGLMAGNFNGARFGYASTEDVVAEIARDVLEYAPTGQDGPVIYGYATMPAMFQGQVCIVQLLREPGGWRPASLFYAVPDDGATLADVISYDLPVMSLSHLHTLPLDTDVHALN